MSKDGRLFSISVNMAVLLQSLAAMELVSTDRETESLVTPCGRPCGDLWPCLEKVDKLTARHPFCPVWGDLAKTAFNHAGRECRAAKMGGNRGWLAGSKCVQVKGFMLLPQPKPEKTPPGKAVWKSESAYLFLGHRNF